MEGDEREEEEEDVRGKVGISRFYTDIFEKRLTSTDTVKKVSSLYSPANVFLRIPF